MNMKIVSYKIACQTGAGKAQGGLIRLKLENDQECDVRFGSLQDIAAMDTLLRSNRRGFYDPDTQLVEII